jgi:hypothetical protein
MVTGRMNRHRYSNEFKTTATSLAGYPVILTQDVTAVLDIHPFMLSRILTAHKREERRENEKDMFGWGL